MAQDASSPGGPKAGTGGGMDGWGAGGCGMWGVRDRKGEKLKIKKLFFKINNLLIKIIKIKIIY